MHIQAKKATEQKAKKEVITNNITNNKLDIIDDKLTLLLNTMLTRPTNTRFSYCKEIFLRFFL